MRGTYPLPEGFENMALQLRAHLSPKESHITKVKRELCVYKICKKDDSKHSPRRCRSAASGSSELIANAVKRAVVRVDVVDSRAAAGSSADTKLVQLRHGLSKVLEE